MDWKHWMKGLVAAAIGGGSNAITLIIVDPLNFNVFQGGFTKLATVAGVSALVSAAMYLKQSPLPDDVVTTKVEVKTTTSVKDNSTGDGD